MRYFTLGEILIAALSFFLLGAVLGCLYKSVGAALKFPRSYMHALVSEIYSALNFHLKTKKQETKISSEIVRNEFYHLIATVGIGACYLLISYLFLDGAFRLYTVLILLLGFYLGDCYVGRYTAHLIGCILRLFTVFSQRVLIRPVTAALIWIKRAFSDRKQRSK